MPWRRNGSGVQPRMCKQLCFSLSPSNSWTVHHATVSSHIIRLRIGAMRNKTHCLFLRSTPYGYNEFLSTPYKSCQGVESLNPGCMLPRLKRWGVGLSSCGLGPRQEKGASLTRLAHQCTPRSQVYCLTLELGNSNRIRCLGLCLDFGRFNPWIYTSECRALKSVVRAQVEEITWAKRWNAVVEV